MVEAGKKAAQTRATATYTFDEHLEGKPEQTQALARAVQEFATGLDPSIEEVPKQEYVAYKGSQNIICMQVQKTQLRLYLKVDPDELEQIPETGRDVRDIGHVGTGDFELVVSDEEDLAEAKPYMEMSYQAVGG
jgi:predicted transport protein